jgi:outer membrane receptor for ferrienterochelin and colicins
MKNIFLIFILLFVSTHLFGQQIAGRVLVDENGALQPIPGVNVYWENTRQGTVTNPEGNFSIRQRPGQHMLVFSFVGYESAIVHIDDQEPVEVILKPNLELGEVTIIQKDRGTYLSTISPIQTERIGGAELHKAACCNLAESFETNPSVDVSYNDAITGAKQIRLLGLDGIYSQLQTENIANFRGLATNFGLTYIPGPWMESILVSKGAASVINGYESIAGQINVDFKKPDSQEKLHLNAFASADGKTEFNANTNVRLYKDKLTTGIFFHAENLSNRIDHNHDGFLDHPLNTQVHFYNAWKYNNFNGLMLHGGLRFLIDDRQGGQSSFENGMARTMSNPYGIGIENRLYEGIFKAGYVFPSQSSAIAVLTNVVRHNMNSFYGLSNYNGDETRLTANLIWTQDLDDHGHHTLNSGISYFYNTFDEVLAEMSDMYRKESVPGLFSEYTFKPSEKLTLMAGIRTDFHNTFGNFVTPRMHFRYQPDPRWTIRLSAGKGYRTANVLAENSFLLTSYRVLQFVETMQEEAWNYGFNFIQSYKLFDRDLQISAEIYRTDFIKQLLVDRETDPNHIIIAPLAGDSYATSWQVDVRYPIIRNLDLTVAWRQNDVKQTIGGVLLEKPLTSRYKGLITMNYTTNLKKWMFDYTVQFNGGGRLPLVLEDMTHRMNHNYPEFPSYTIMNAQVTRYFRKWSVYAGSENLTDFMQMHPVQGADNPFEPGFDATQIWGPVSGRRIYAGIRFTLNYN